MKKFNSISVNMLFTEVIALLAIFIKNKILAIFIGPNGFGIFALLNSFFLFITSITTAGLPISLTKYIAEYRVNEENNKIELVFSFSLLFSSVLNLVIFMLLIIFHQDFYKYFLDPSLLHLYYILFCFASFGNTIKPILMAILQGLKDFKTIIFYRIFIGLFELLLILVLVYYFGILGLFITILILSIFNIKYLYTSVIKNNIKFIIDLNRSYYPIIKPVFRFARINFILSIINYLSQFLFRSFIAKIFGIQVLGIFQIGFSIMNYTNIFNRAAIIKFLPTMSEKMSLENRNILINQYIRWLVYSNILLMFGIIVFSSTIIKIFFDPSFMKIINYLWLFLLAQFFININEVFQNVIIGMGLLKVHFWGSTIYYLVMLSSLIFSIQFIEEFGIPISLLISILFLIIFNLVYLIKHGMIIYINNIINIILVIIVLPIGLILSFYSYVIGIISFMIIIILTYSIMKKDDIVLLINIIKQYSFLK